MDILKQAFPMSFKMTGSVANLVIGCIIYVVVSVVVSAVVGVLLGFLGQIPLMKLVTDITASLVGVYTTAGIVIMFLYHFKVLKD